MIKQYNALVIGAGKIGAFFDSPKDKLRVLTHAHAFTKHQGFKLVGFYDTDRSKAEGAAKIWGTKSFNSLPEAFDENPIDVVSIAVPDELHYQILKEIAKYRPRVVFTEKPITTNKLEGEEILEIYKKFNIPIIVNYNRRFVPEFIKIRDEYKSGVYGKFIGGTGYYGKGISHNGSHLINLLRFFFDEIKLDKIIDYGIDFSINDPSVSVVLNIKNKKFILHHISSLLFTIFEIDLLFEKVRIRFIDSGEKIELQEIKEDHIHRGYKNMVKAREMTSSLHSSIYFAIDNIYGFLNKGNKLINTGEDALKDLSLCLDVSKKIKFKKRVLLFSHDPGGANMVFPLVKPLINKGYKVFLYGKSFSLIKYSEFGLKASDITKKIPEVNPLNIKKLIKSLSPNFIVTGTSGKDMTEKYIWRAASELKITSFALLDGWLNCSIRFPLDDKGVVYAPTKICVIDNSAKKYAMVNGLRNRMFITTGSPYFEFLVQRNLETIKINLIKNRNLKNKKNAIVLFISEPLSKFYKENYGSETYLGYTEKTIFTNIYSSLSKISTNKRVEIVIKNHPQEDAKTFDKFIKETAHDKNIKIRKADIDGLSNWDLINSADIVCGMGSTMLIEAFLLGKPTISVYIGDKKHYPNVFDKNSAVKAIRTQSDLDQKILDIIEKGIIPKYNHITKNDSIQKIISGMEKIIWQS